MTVAAPRSGGGVAYSDYGREFRHGQGHINRPAFTHELSTEWLRAMPDVVARLESARHPRIADIGCGQGFSTLALAHAQDAGLDARVRFMCTDAGELASRGPYDLVLILEALHDLADPAGALRAALADGGTVLVVDEKVAHVFTAPGDEVERMMYGWSVTHCLPTQQAEQPSAALGTVMRAGTVRELAAAAGYARVDVLPVDNDFFRLYRLDP